MIGAVALIASLAMTAVYHTGYSDFRSGKVGKPLTGDVVWSVPTLVRSNPLGAPIAHRPARVRRNYTATTRTPSCHPTSDPPNAVGCALEHQSIKLPSYNCQRGGMPNLEGDV